MKLLKKLFFAISLVLMLGCIGIFACAMNPSVTKALAAALYGKEETTEQQEVVSEVIPENKQETAEGKPPVSEYVTPSEDSLMLPESVYGKTGYEPIQSQGIQVAEEEAITLKEQLQTGETGDALSFNTVLYPYYAMLGGEQQQLYRQIYANAEQLVGSFAPVVTVSTEQLKDVFEAVYNDHPELFWLETGYSCKYNGAGQCVEITLKYNSTAANLAETKQSFQSQARMIIDEAEKFTTASERAKYVHDVLLSRVSYDATAPMNQSAYSALVNGASVCAGYSRAFQYLMQQLSVPCYYCTGFSGADHAWNIIQLAGGYYNVDVTWDDTDPGTYDYYNKTDAEYAKTHVRKSLSVKLPVCNGKVETIVAVEPLTPEESLNSGGIQYINPNPQQPLQYPKDPFANNTAEEERLANLNKAGITEEEVMDTMEEYYADCLKKMVDVGAGQKYFTNVVPQSLWLSVERAYAGTDYEKGYVREALKQLKMEYFAIQLQVEDLSGGYYRIYHNISTW